jgi:hypothetical protein
MKQSACEEPLAPPSDDWVAGTYEVGDDVRIVRAIDTGDQGLCVVDEGPDALLRRRSGPRASRSAGAARRTSRHRGCLARAGARLRGCRRVAHVGRPVRTPAAVDGGAESLPRKGKKTHLALASPSNADNHVHRPLLGAGVKFRLGAAARNPYRSLPPSLSSSEPRRRIRQPIRTREVRPHPLTNPQLMSRSCWTGSTFFKRVGTAASSLVASSGASRGSISS